MLEEAPQSMISVQPIGAMFALDIGWPISFNQYKDLKQRTTAKGRAWRDATTAIIWRQCGNWHPEPLNGRCAIYWELWRPNDRRRRDLDNYTGKHVLDCLVKAGILVDDDMNHITEEHKFLRGVWKTGRVLVTALEI